MSKNTTESRPTCDCGKPGQWWGDTQGLRVFACAECAAADPSLPYEFKPWRIEENPPPITGYDISKTVCIAVGDSGLALFGGKARAEAERAIACVNACACMADPSAEIAALREALIALEVACTESLVDHQQGTAGLVAATHAARAALKGGAK